MAPPLKRQKHSKVPRITLSARKVLESDTPILDQDIHGFITRALSPAFWPQYSEAEKRMLIQLFPYEYRNYNVDLEGRLECPVSMEFLQSDTYLKAGVARFKRDVKDGYWGPRWQNHARRAMQERMEGRFDEHLRSHTEECFGEELGDQNKGGEGRSVSESDWEQEQREKRAEEEEYIVERLLQLSPSGTQIEVKWAGYGKTTWESRAGLLQDLPEMVSAMQTRETGVLERAALQEEGHITAQDNHLLLSGWTDVVEGADIGIKDVNIDASRGI